MQITTNLRATINEGQNINQGRDFSDLGVGNIKNLKGFSDNLNQLDLSISGGNYVLSKGACFLRYEKNNQQAFMKCELTQNYTDTVRSGVEYLFVRLVNSVITSGSTQVDGGDYFVLEFANSLPSGATDYVYPLFSIDRDASGGPAITDLREKRDAEFRDLVINNMIANEITANDVILPGGSIQNQINNMNQNLGTGGDFVNVELGEDITAGDKQGAVFYGKGIMKTGRQEQLNNNTDLNLGQSDSNTRVGLAFKTSSNPKEDIICAGRIRIRRAGSPTGNVIVKLFESDKVTPVAGFSPISFQASTLPTTYQTGNLYFLLNMQNIAVSPNTFYFMEFSRDVAFDSSNYIKISASNNNSSPDYGTATYQSSTSTWTDSNNDPFLILEYAHNYEVGKVFASDPDYEGTNTCDGILTQPGVAGDIRSMQIRGQKADRVYPGLNYFLSKNKDSLEQGYKNTSDRGILLNLKEEDGANPTIYDNRYYMSFIPSVNLTLSSVEFYVDYFTNNLANHVRHNIQIHPDNGSGLPDTATILATNTQSLPKLIPHIKDELTTNSISYTMTAGIKYWIGFYGIVGSGNAGYIRLRGTYDNSPYSDHAYVQGGTGNPAINLTLDNSRNINFKLNFVESEAVSIDKVQGIISSPIAENGRYSVQKPSSQIPRHIGIGDTTDKMRILTEESNSDYGYTGIEYSGDDLGIAGSVASSNTFEKEVYVGAIYLYNLSFYLTRGNSSASSSVLEISYSKDGFNYTPVITETNPSANSTYSRVMSLLLKKGYYKFKLTTGNVSSGGFGSSGFSTRISKL